MGWNNGGGGFHYLAQIETEEQCPFANPGGWKTGRFRCVNGAAPQSRPSQFDAIQAVGALAPNLEGVVLNPAGPFGLVTPDGVLQDKTLWPTVPGLPYTIDPTTGKPVYSTNGADFCKIRFREIRMPRVFGNYAGIGGVGRYPGGPGTTSGGFQPTPFGGCVAWVIPPGIILRREDNPSAVSDVLPNTTIFVGPFASSAAAVAHRDAWLAASV